MLKYSHHTNTFLWDKPGEAQHEIRNFEAAYLKNPKSPAAERALHTLSLRYTLASIPLSFRHYESPEGLSYLPFQCAGIDYAISSPEGCLLACDMGTGKTIIACGLINTEKPERTVVVCPASLKENWRRELMKWTGVDETMVALVKPGKKPLPSRFRFLIINYEMLNKYKELLTTYFWDMMILDESQKVANVDAKCSQVAATLKAKRKYLLSGTPLLNRTRELWNQLNFIQPGRWGTYQEFGIRYCAGHMQTTKLTGYEMTALADGRTAMMPVYGKAWNYEGNSNSDELATLLRLRCMYRIEKKDALPQLPAKTIMIIPIAANNKIKKAEKNYQQFANSLEDFEGGDTFGELAELRHETGLLKVPAISKHLVDTLNEDETRKIIVFAHHHDVIDQYMDKLGKFNPVVFTGRNSETEKQAAVDAFMLNPAVRVMAASMRATGVGLNLTAACLGVFAELDPVPGWMNQCIDRLHRIGQKKHVTGQHFAYEGTIDAKLTKLLVHKQRLTDRVINN